MADEKRCTCRDKEFDLMVYGNHFCFVPADGGPSERVDFRAFAEDVWSKQPPERQWFALRSKEEEP